MPASLQETFTAFVDATATASSIGNTDYVPIIQGGVTKKLPGSALGAFLTATPANVFTPYTADFAISSKTTFGVQASTAASSTPEFGVIAQLSAATGASGYQKTALLAGVLALNGCYDANAVVGTVEIAASNSTCTTANAGYFNCLNNNANAPTGSPNSYNGVSVTNTGSFTATTALTVEGAWGYGLTFGSNTASICGIYLQAGGSYGMQLGTAIHGVAGISFGGSQCVYGIDFNAPTAISNGAIRLGSWVSGSNGPSYILGRNQANSIDFPVIGTAVVTGTTASIVIGGGETGNVFPYGHIVPGSLTSPILNIGSGLWQWADIYCVQLIQSSGEATKNILGPLGDVDAAFDALELFEYTLKIGGADDQIVYESHEEIVKTKVTKNVTTSKLIDGVARSVVEQHVEEQAQYDEYPVIDKSTGKQVMTVYPAQPAIIDKTTGRVVRPAIPSYSLPMIHREPQKHIVQVPVTRKVPRPGKRVRIGATAANIRDAFAKISPKDYAVYKAENGSENYQPDQTMWLIAAQLKSVKARLAALEAKLHG